MSIITIDLVNRHSLTDPVGKNPTADRLSAHRTKARRRTTIHQRNPLDSQTGAPWRDLPKEFGYWNAVYHRFLSLTRSENIIHIFQVLIQTKYDLGEIKLDFAAIDGTIIRVHKAAAGAPSKKTKMSRKTMPLENPEADEPRKSSPPPSGVFSHFP